MSTFPSKVLLLDSVTAMMGHQNMNDFIIYHIKDPYNTHDVGTKKLYGH